MQHNQFGRSQFNHYLSVNRFHILHYKDIVLKRIGLISDTHGFLDEKLGNILSSCDEIWHAGDFGNLDLVEAIRKMKPLRGVYGNIDGREIRDEFPEVLRFSCEAVSVLMIHIGGYPDRYSPVAKKEIH